MAQEIALVWLPRWEVRDARRLGIPHWMTVPALLLTFLLGPIGLLTYLSIRLIRAKNLNLDEQPSHQ